MIVWTFAVSPWDTAIQYHKGIGTDTTRQGVQRGGGTIQIPGQHVKRQESRM
jgi:hypothetical protein